MTAQLWRGLSEADKRRFIAEDARSWDVHRHRMAPATARRFDAIADEGRLERHRGTIAAVRAGDHALHVTLDDGTELRVAAVVNCTGPVGSIAADPLMTRLAQTGLVRPGPAGLGIDTADDGRILGTLPDHLPFLAVGSLRRGNLWESTAMPEIREQAYDVARVVSRSMHGESRRRPVDPYGLTLSTSGDAAERYNAALGRLLRLQDGVEDGLAAAVAEDEGFVQAHAALALLGHEWGTNDHWHASLRAAHRAAAERHLDDRESSFLDAVTTRLRTDEATGAAALLRHVRLFPRDALAVSVAVPTVAFGGLTSGSQTAAAGRVARPVLRRRLVVRRPARVRPPGPGALGRGGGAVVVRPLRRAGLRPRRPRPRPRLLRDRRPHAPGSPGSTSGSVRAAPRPTTARTSPGTPRSTS